MTTIRGEIEEPVNWKAASDRLDGNEELLIELAALFCVECPKLVSALRDAVSRKNPEAIRAASHSLKGVLGTFSADTAAHTAAKLEEMAAAGTVTGLDEVSALLLSEVEAVFAALQGISNGTRTPARAPGSAKIR